MTGRISELCFVVSLILVVVDGQSDYNTTMARLNALETLLAEEKQLRMHLEDNVNEAMSRLSELETFQDECGIYLFIYLLYEY